jgi:hypothetical protein
MLQAFVAVLVGFLVLSPGLLLGNWLSVPRRQPWFPSVHRSAFVLSVLIVASAGVSRREVGCVLPVA